MYIYMYIYIYIYMYIYIYCHPQTDCFVLSELFSVARHAGPRWLREFFKVFYIATALQCG